MHGRHLAPVRRDLIWLNGKRPPINEHFRSSFDVSSSMYTSLCMVNKYNFITNFTLLCSFNRIIVYVDNAIISKVDGLFDSTSIQIHMYLMCISAQSLSVDCSMFMYIQICVSSAMYTLTAHTHTHKHTHPMTYQEFRLFITHTYENKPNLANRKTHFPTQINNMILYYML